MHKSLAVVAGAAGGAFGISSLPVELPFSTTIMLRSIADIARSEGEDLSDPKTALTCLEVFALGGRADADKQIRFPEIDVADYNFEEGAALETGYFAVRAILAKSVTEAASYLSGRGVVNEVAPALIRWIGQIGTHFGVVVSQKLIAQSVPLIGAAGGAALSRFTETTSLVPAFLLLRAMRSPGSRRLLLPGSARSSPCEARTTNVTPCGFSGRSCNGPLCRTSCQSGLSPS
jgi:EcsC protein family